MSAMAEAHRRCTELGIDTDAPDALDRLWQAVDAEERRELFPYATDYDAAAVFYPNGVPALTEPSDGMVPAAPAEVAPPTRVVVTDRRHSDSYREGVVVRAEPDPLGRVRVRFDGMADDDWAAIETDILGRVAVPGERYRWTDRNNAARVPFTVGERFAAGHRFAGLFRIMSDDASPAEISDGHTAIASPTELAKFAERVTTTAPPRVIPGALDAAHARVLASEHIRRARVRLAPDVPPGGRPWRPGDVPRLQVLTDAATTLARLCAVYLTGESERNHAEARAYALAFKLVEQSARRLAHRRPR